MNKATNSTMFHECALKFLVRKYGVDRATEMLDTDSIDVLDRKVIASMEKLKCSYAQHRDKKVQTVLIEYQRIPLCPPKEPKEIKAPKEIAKPKQECRAIKMNGTKCTAKTKHGDFCARHMKKTI